MNDAFLPADYQPPSNSSGGKYLRFKEGITKFRVLSKAACRGWIYWTQEGKPVRVREKPTQILPLGIRTDDHGKPDKIKPFWAVVIWDYETREVAILDITQATVQREIHGLYIDSDWGHPNGYDIKVTRSGSGLETEYLVSPAPHKEFNYAVAEGWESINLEALFDNGDPFSSSSNGNGNGSGNGNHATDTDSLSGLPIWRNLGFNSENQYAGAWTKFDVLNEAATVRGLGLQIDRSATTLQELTDLATALKETLASEVDKSDIPF